MSLRRSLADWPIVLAALLTMLLSTTLLAAGPMYSSAVSAAGLRQLLREASVEAGNVQVSAGVPHADLETADAAITAELSRVAGSTPSEIARFGTAAAFALPGQGTEVRDLTVPGFAEGIEAHATVLAGEWPAADAVTPAPEPVPVSISEAVASQLGYIVGDRLELVSRLDDDLVLPVRIAAIFAVNDDRDPYWWADERMLGGVTEGSQYRTFGPFVMSRADMLGRAVVGNVSGEWRLLPDYGNISVDDLGGLRSRLGSFSDRLGNAAGAFTPSVDTNLSDTLASASQALLVSRTGMLLVMAQLALLGGYAILLTSGLLVDHRRVETAMLRSRGAGAGHLAGLAAVEGLLLAIPAVLLGPVVALGALTVFDSFGPMAQIGLSVPVRITTDAYLAAGVAGLACVLLLAIPALFSARSFTAVQQSASRAETRPLAARMGIDIALLALAAVALWQLRLYGAPLTRTLQGTLGPDPLLVAAPALGLLLGAVIATRVLPRLAEVAQRVLGRGRGLVGALGSTQLARRPLRYTRSALMLMLAMSIGVFAVSYAATWTDSQRAQADHQVGVDARVFPARSVLAMPDLALASEYEKLPGIEAQMPVERFEVQLTRTEKATVIALDAGSAPRMIQFRSDQADTTLESLMAPLAEARPEVSLATIPAGSTVLTVVPVIEIRALETFYFNPATGNVGRRDADPALFDETAVVAASIAVRDERGLVHRFRTALQPIEEARAGIAVTLPESTEQLSLISVDLLVAMAEELIVTEGTIAVGSVSAGSDAVAPAPLQIGAPGDWQLTWQDPIREPMTPSVPATDAIGLNVGTGQQPHEFFTDGPGAPVTLSMQPLAISAAAPDVVPAVVTRAMLEATGLAVGDVFQMNLVGAERDVRIVGAVNSFPTVDASTALAVIDLPTLSIVRFDAAHGVTRGAAPSELRRPDEWWLDLTSTTGTGADPQVADEVSRSLSTRPFNSAGVTTAVGRLRSLVSDPVALGIIGALGIGAIAAGLFALIGLALAAFVSARQRQGEFALVRALGLSRRQMTAWLWLENGSLAVISVLVGAALGALISWVVLPSVTLTSNGAPPTPPVLVNLPLPTIALLALLAAIALAVIVLAVAAVLRRVGIGNVLRLSEE